MLSHENRPHPGLFFIVMILAALAIMLMLLLGSSWLFIGSGDILWLSCASIKIRALFCALLPGIVFTALSKLVFPLTEKIILLSLGRATLAMLIAMGIMSIAKKTDAVDILILSIFALSIIYSVVLTALNLEEEKPKQHVSNPDILDDAEYSSQE